MECFHSCWFVVESSFLISLVCQPLLRPHVSELPSPLSPWTSSFGDIPDLQLTVQYTNNHPPSPGFVSPSPWSDVHLAFNPEVLFDTSIEVHRSLQWLFGHFGTLVLRWLITDTVRDVQWQTSSQHPFSVYQPASNESWCQYHGRWHGICLQPWEKPWERVIAYCQRQSTPNGDFHSAHTVTIKVVSRIVLTRMDSFLAKGLFYNCNLISNIRFKTK